MVNAVSEIPPLAEYIAREVIDGERFEIATHQDVIKRVLQVVLTVLGIGAEATSLRAAFTSDPGHRNREIIYGGGGPLAYAILNVWGGLRLVNELLDPLSELGKACVQKKAPTTAEEACPRLKKVAYIGIITLTGLTSQIPWGEVAYKFNNIFSTNIRISLIGIKLLGTASVPTYSLYLLLENLRRMRTPITRCCPWTPDVIEHRLEQVKKRLLAGISYRIDRTPRLTSDERVDCALASYINIQQETAPIEKVNRLFHCIEEDYRLGMQKSSKCLSTSRKMVQVVAALTTPALLVQLIGLTDIITRTFYDSIPLRVAMCALTTITAGYLTIKMPIDAAGKIHDKLLSPFTKQIPSGFGETFYPKATRLLQLLGIALASTSIGLNRAVASQVLSWDSGQGKLYLTAALTGYTLQLTDAILDLIDDTMLTVAKCSTNDEIQNALSLRKSLIKLRKIIDRSSYLEFGKFLNHLEPALKERITKDMLTISDLESYLEKKKESEPLLLP